MFRAELFFSNRCVVVQLNFLGDELATNTQRHHLESPINEVAFQNWTYYYIIGIVTFPSAERKILRHLQVCNMNTVLRKNDICFNASLFLHKNRFRFCVII